MQAVATSQAWSRRHAAPPVVKASDSAEFPAAALEPHEFRSIFQLTHPSLQSFARPGPARTVHAGLHPPQQGRVSSFIQLQRTLPAAGHGPPAIWELFESSYHHRFLACAPRATAGTQRALQLQPPRKAAPATPPPCIAHTASQSSAVASAAWRVRPSSWSFCPRRLQRFLTWACADLVPPPPPPPLIFDINFSNRVKVLHRRCRLYGCNTSRSFAEMNSALNEHLCPMRRRKRLQYMQAIRLSSQRIRRSKGWYHMHEVVRSSRQ